MALQRVEVGLELPGGVRRPVTFLLDPALRTQGDILKAFQGGRMYERHTSAAVLRLLKPGDGFVDVGAHVGYYALLAHAAAGPTARILAFEPNPETYRTLVLNVMANRAASVHTFNCAIGERAETQTFHLNDDNEGESALWDVATMPGFAHSAARKRTASVACMPLDMIAATGDFGDVRMVKIDAEGWEAKVVAGAQGLLTWHRPPYVVCEINRSALARCGTSEAELRHAFARLGYGCHLVNLSGVDLCRGKSLCRLADGEMVDTPYVFNLLFSLFELDF